MRPRPTFFTCLLAAVFFPACDKLPMRGGPSAVADAAAAAAGPWTVVADTQRAYGKIIWDGNRFLAGCGANILSSPDGIHWTSVNPGMSNNIWGLANNGTLTVAVGTDGGIATSADGTTWTPRSSGVTGRLFTVLWANNQFFVYGDGGVILTSPDGITWTAQPGVPPYALHHGVFTGREFVVTADKGILVSTDGVRFRMEKPTDNRQMDVAWNGQTFVSVGGGGDITMLTSPNATFWTQVKPPSAAGLSSIIWTGRHFVATGAGGVLLTSPDGIAWTAHSVGIPEDLVGVAWNGEVLVVTTTTGNVLASGTSSRVKLR